MLINRRDLLGMLAVVPLVPVPKLTYATGGLLPRLTHPYGDLRHSRYRHNGWEHVTTGGSVLVKEHADGGYVIVKGHRQAMKMRFKEGKRDIPIRILRDNWFVADFEIKDIEINPCRLREPEDNQIPKLVKDMKRVGQIYPIGVTLIQGSLMLVDGHARLKALQHFHYPRISCLVRIARMFMNDLLILSGMNMVAI